MIGADVRADHGGIDLVGCHLQVPPGADPAFPAVLARLIAQHEVDLYVPIMENELLACAHHREQIEAAGARVVLSKRAAIERCRSKSRLAEAMLEAGLAVPSPIEPGASFPVFVRPEDGTGSRGAAVAQDVEALARIQRMIGAPVVTTEVIEGPEYSVDGFADDTHELRGLVCRSRDEVRGGLSVRSMVVPVPVEVAAGLARLTKNLGLVGLFNLQFRTCEGQALCFDLNPRPAGAMALSYAAGLDPAPRLLALLGEAPWPEVAPARLGLRLRRRWHDLILEPEADQAPSPEPDPGA